VALEVQSITQAMLLSRMTVAQRDSMTAIDGMLVYVTDAPGGAQTMQRAAGAWINVLGTVGPSGPPGLDGLDGADGAPGDTGPAGAAGVAGAAGAPGAMGPPGLDGIDGADGAPGPAGAAGPAGPGGSATITQVELDLGTTPVAEATVNTVDAAVTTATKIIFALSGIAPTGKDEDELEMDDLMIVPHPRAGSIDWFVRGNDGYIADKFKLEYAIG
jgi:hypothetical protein